MTLHFHIISILCWDFAATSVQASDTLPNVLFIIVDDLGWADVGIYGSDFYETPNIDQLATQGMRFTDAYVASPMCSPTRASILTGKHPARLQMTNWIGAPQPDAYPWNTVLRSAAYKEVLDLEEYTLAESLQSSGYQTHFVGKWHLGKPAQYWPEHQGFDTNIAGCAWGAPIGGDKFFSPYGNPRLKDGPAGEHLPDRLAKETIKRMEKAGDKPFFMLLSFYSVHSPWIAREDLTRKYEQKHSPPDKWRQERFIRFAETQNNAVYAAMIEAMDIAIGDVLTRLDELGLAQNTIVVFVSDNGGASEVTSNAPLRAGKCFLYEGGIRVPLIVRWPEHIQAGSVTNKPVSSTDFYPTILELAGLPLEEGNHVDANSFAGLLRGKGGGRETIFWHYPHYEGGFEPASAIRHKKWKLIEFYEESKVELYDLLKDIGEHNNVAIDYPKVTQALQKKLHSWREKVGAAAPTANPNFDPFKTQNYRVDYQSAFQGVNQFEARNQ
ncbi:MAG: sulfatase [Saprospiraceae bacterium]|nr:sulfatase [Saprospiraceae bacterium]